MSDYPDDAQTAILERHDEAEPVPFRPHANGNGHAADEAAAWPVLTSFDQIPKPGDDRPIVVVPVPQWKMRVSLRALDQDEKDDWELRDVKDWNVEPDEELRNERSRSRTLEDITRGVTALLVAKHMVTPDGKRLVRSAQADASAFALQKANAGALALLAEVARGLSGLTQADIASLAKKLLAAHGSAPPSI